MDSSYYLLHGVSEDELPWSKLFYVLQETGGYSSHIKKGGEGSTENLMGVQREQSIAEPHQKYNCNQNWTRMPRLEVSVPLDCMVRQYNTVDEGSGYGLKQIKV